MTGRSFHKSRTGRLLNYLFVLPLFLGVRPLIVGFSLLDTLIYLGGAVLVIGLIMYNNSIPYILWDEISIKVLLPYREEREEHRFDTMEGYVVKGKRSVVLLSRDHRPLRIFLNPQDCRDFTAILNREGVSEIKRKRGRKR